MYERFTDRARRAMLLANKEARDRNHEYVGTEHLVIAIMNLDVGGVAYQAMRNMGITQKMMLDEVNQLVSNGPDNHVTMAKLPNTPRIKKVIQYAMDASRELNHNHVGTEHLLLGLIREEDGRASIILKKLGVTKEAFLESCGQVMKEFADNAPDLERNLLSVLGSLDPLSMKKPEAGTEDFRVEQLKNIVSAIYRFSTGEVTSENCLNEIRQFLA